MKQGVVDIDFLKCNGHRLCVSTKDHDLKNKQVMQAKSLGTFQSLQLGEAQLLLLECGSTLYVGMPQKRNGRPIHCTLHSV